MSKKALAAVAIAALGVTGVAGAAMAATGNGNGNGNGNWSGNGTGRATSSAERFGNDHADGNGSCDGSGTTAGTPSPLRDGSGRSASGWGRNDGTGGNRAGGHGPAAGGQGSPSGTHESDVPAAVPGATISDEVAEMLTFMVQEEQLARDVYALAINEHGDRVFVNINRAESHHMTEVQALLDRYGIDDPTETKGAGSFTDTELTGMYADLAGQVETDRAGAIAAGIAVEKADIADLEDALKLEAPAYVTVVLQNRLAGSERHLAAFERNA